MFFWSCCFGWGSTIVWASVVAPNCSPHHQKQKRGRRVKGPTNPSRTHPQWPKGLPQGSIRRRREIRKCTHVCTLSCHALCQDCEQEGHHQMQVLNLGSLELWAEVNLFSFYSSVPLVFHYSNTKQTNLLRDMSYCNRTKCPENGISFSLCLDVFNSKSFPT
jgi:hypothetical protein